jgi:hypothetical protein
MWRLGALLACMTRSRLSSLKKFGFADLPDVAPHDRHTPDKFIHIFRLPCGGKPLATWAHRGQAQPAEICYDLMGFHRELSLSGMANSKLSLSLRFVTRSIVLLLSSVSAIEDLQPSSWKTWDQPPIDQTVDPVLHSIPRGIHPSLLHPYFKRIDFAPKQSAVEMHIGRVTSPFGLYTGPGLREIDALQRNGPLGPDGPLQMKGSPFLTPLIRKCEEPFKFHFSGVDNMWEDDFGDVGNFRREKMRQFSMGADEPFDSQSIPNPMDNLVRAPTQHTPPSTLASPPTPTPLRDQPTPTRHRHAPPPMRAMRQAPRRIRLHESRQLRALGAGADAALTNPEDFFTLAKVRRPRRPRPTPRAPAWRTAGGRHGGGQHVSGLV